MKAIVVRQFGGPEVLEFTDVPDPVPGPGQVLLTVHAAGVNPVDTYIHSGTYAVKPALPYIPGRDCAGVVTGVGSGVTTWTPGDRVYADGVSQGSGAYAALTVCEAAQLHPLPERASFPQGAALGVPYATAWRALFDRGHARAGETLLVHGASGGVGIAVTQIARAHGLRVIGTAGTVNGLRLVQKEGAHHALNHREPTYVDEVKQLTGGKGVDLIVEMLANVNLDGDLDLLAPRGRVVVVGNRGRTEIDPRKIMARDAAVLGMVVFNASRDELNRIHAGLVAGLEQGTLRPVIRKELPLADAAKAHVEIMQPGAYGKIVLVP